jgi:hypothetical protein
MLAGTGYGTYWKTYYASLDKLGVHIVVRRRTLNLKDDLDKAPRKILDQNNL